MIEDRLPRDGERAQYKLLRKISLPISLLIFTLSSTTARVSSMRRYTPRTDVNLLRLPSRMVLDRCIPLRRVKHRIISRDDGGRVFDGDGS